MKKILGLSATTVFIFALATSFVFAKNDNNKSKDKSSSKSKSEVVKELKNYEKPTQGKTNASIHREKIDKVSTDLKETAEKAKGKKQEREEKAIEKRIGNPESGKQEKAKVKIKTREEAIKEIEEVAQETEEVEEVTVEAIEKVEKRGGVKKFFIGTDYKNLGQLRSSLVHNRNQIRKLTNLSDSVIDEETKLSIESQLTVLMQERERIKTVVTDNEEGFSLLGWAFRLINGYPKDSIDDREEIELVAEVAEVFEDENIQDEDEATEESSTVIEN